ncbi:MAG: DUF2004 domain-containing protein [Chitinophagaceae bacterium]|nr:DUF2004 domain-containing protein [Chitinophagaceae bacterium]
MNKYNLPHFGELDLDSLEEYNDVDIEFKGQPVQIDLNFEGKTITPKRLDVVKHFIGQLLEHDERNLKEIRKDYEDGDTVKEYIDHHLEEVGPEEYDGVIDFEDETKTPQEQLLSALRLVRIGLYPDSEDKFAIFDYSIGQELTQYLVVVNTDEKGNLDYMTMES